MADNGDIQRPTEIDADISLFEVGNDIYYLGLDYYGSDGIAVNPSQFLPYFLVHSEGITFTVAYDSEYVVKAVFVGHYPTFLVPGELFKTPEGVSIEMSYREVLELIPNIRARRILYGYEATLPSGWKIGFMTSLFENHRQHRVGDVVTWYGNCNYEDKIIMIYKDEIIRSNTKDQNILKKTVYWYFLLFLIPFSIIILFLVRKRIKVKHCVLVGIAAFIVCAFVLIFAFAIRQDDDAVMTWIKPGNFQMGSPVDEPGRSNKETRHQVTLTKGFYMSKYQVTQAQYEEVMGTNPSAHKIGGSQTSRLDEIADTANFPVEEVSWYDAIVFCNKLSMKEGLNPAYLINGSTDPADWGTIPKNNDSTWDTVQIVADSNGYRLPTEAQWEYACRAGTTTAYNTGATISDNSSWYSDNSGGRTHKVGEKTPNAWGLYDMHGNVSEWCWDWYGTYERGSQTDPTGVASSYGRVNRGGRYSLPASFARSADRGGSSPYFKSVYIGFRLVRE
jgi:formylglycine-generating enzyme required for sulfatase activity